MLHPGGPELARQAGLSKQASYPLGMRQYLYTKKGPAAPGERPHPVPTETLRGHHHLSGRITERPLRQFGQELALKGPRTVHGDDGSGSDKSHGLRGTDFGDNFKGSYGQLMTGSRPLAVDIDSSRRQPPDAVDE